MAEASGEAKSKPKAKQRIHLLDELRGFAVFCMIFYHAFYSIGVFFNWSWGVQLVQFFSPAEPFFAGLFILISGISSNLSRSNIERGAKLLFIAYIVTVVTLLAVGPGSVIRFGILHCLSVCMMLYGVLSRFLKLIPLWIGVAVNAVLLVLCSSIGIYQSRSVVIPFLWSWRLPDVLYETDTLYALGFSTSHFVSSDYFPILPWVFVFMMGCFFGRLAAQKKFPKFTYQKHIPFFAFMGRHALIIYLVHQPVIFGICKMTQLILSAVGQGG